jgi:hypothetical protein
MINTDYDNSLFPGQIFCILNTMDYKHLNDPTHKILTKDAMQSMECKTILLIKKVFTVGICHPAIVTT